MAIGLQEASDKEVSRFLRQEITNYIAMALGMPFGLSIGLFIFTKAWLIPTVLLVGCALAILPNILLGMVLRHHTKKILESGTKISINLNFRKAFAQLSNYAVEFGKIAIKPGFSPGKKKFVLPYATGSMIIDLRRTGKESSMLLVAETKLSSQVWEIVSQAMAD